jgi:dihydroorotase
MPAIDWRLLNDVEEVVNANLTKVHLYLVLAQPIVLPVQPKLQCDCIRRRRKQSRGFKSAHE